MRDPSRTLFDEGMEDDTSDIFELDHETAFLSPRTILRERRGEFSPHVLEIRPPSTLGSQSVYSVQSPTQRHESRYSGSGGRRRSDVANRGNVPITTLDGNVVIPTVEGRRGSAPMSPQRRSVGRRNDVVYNSPHVRRGVDTADENEVMKQQWERKTIKTQIHENGNNQFPSRISPMRIGPSSNVGLSPHLTMTALPTTMKTSRIEEVGSVVYDENGNYIKKLLRQQPRREYTPNMNMDEIADYIRKTIADSLNNPNPSDTINGPSQGRVRVVKYQTEPVVIEAQNHPQITETIYTDSRHHTLETNHRYQTSRHASPVRVSSARNSPFTANRNRSSPHHQARPSLPQAIPIQTSQASRSIRPNRNDGPQTIITNTVKHLFSQPTMIHQVKPGAIKLQFDERRKLFEERQRSVEKEYVQLLSNRMHNLGSSPATPTAGSVLSTPFKSPINSLTDATMSTPLRNTPRGRSASFTPSRKEVPTPPRGRSYSTSSQVSVKIRDSTPQKRLTPFTLNMLADKTSLPEEPMYNGRYTSPVRIGKVETKPFDDIHIKSPVQSRAESKRRRAASFGDDNWNGRSERGRKAEAPISPEHFKPSGDNLGSPSWKYEPPQMSQNPEVEKYINTIYSKKTFSQNDGRSRTNKIRSPVHSPSSDPFVPGGAAINNRQHSPTRFGKPMSFHTFS